MLRAHDGRLDLRMIPTGIHRLKAPRQAEVGRQPPHRLVLDAHADVRTRVGAKRITAWIDGAQVIDQHRAGNAFGIYEQLVPIRPLGLFTWMTGAELRGLRLHPVAE
jgi:hypothetical protein